MSTQRLALLMILLAVAALLAGGCGGKEKVSSHEGGPVVPVQTVEVKEALLPVSLEATGTVMAIRQAELAPKLMARIEAVYVKEGDRVRRGQVLARLESRDLSAGAALASAGLKGAQAAHSQAQVGLTMQRTKSAVDVAQAEAALEQAKAQLAKARQGPRPEQVKQAEDAEARAKAGYEEAQAYLSLTKEGARSQEKRQAEQGVISAQQQVTQAQAGLSTAKAALSTTQRDYDRIKSLFDQDVVPRQQLDHAKLQLDMAQNTVKQAEAGVKQAQAGLSIAKEQQSIAMQGARTQEVFAAEQRVAQAKAAWQQSQQEVVMAKQGGRWEDVTTAQQAVTQAEQALRAAKAAEGRDKVSQEDVKRASAGISQARAGVQSASAMLSYATITAPFEGIITRRSADPGDMASPGMPFLFMDDDSLYQVVATVPESDAGVLRLGQQVSLQLASLGITLTGPVATLVPGVDAATRTMTVKANLPRRHNLKSGLFGTLKVTKAKQMGLIVPKEAVFERDGLTKAYTVDEAGVARLALVKLGREYEGNIEILSGLAKGQTVIVAPPATLREGMPVSR